MTWRKENRTEPPEIRIWTDYLHVWLIRQQLHSSEGGFSGHPIELMILSLLNWWCAAWQQRYQLGETEGHVFGLTVIRSFGLMSSKKKEKERKKREFLWGLWFTCDFHVVKKVTHAVCWWFFFKIRFTVLLKPEDTNLNSWREHLQWSKGWLTCNDRKVKNPLLTFSKIYSCSICFTEFTDKIELHIEF